MLKYKCLVLDHDDTVVQTERHLGFPYFKKYLDKIRPGNSLTFEEYVRDCSSMVFADMCKARWNMTDEECINEYAGWCAYYSSNPHPICPGIERIIRRQKEEGGCNKTYRGLPVTSISFLLPMVFWLQFLMSDLAFLVLLHIVLALVGFLFILDFPLKKPGLKAIIIMMSIAMVTVGIIFMYTKFKLPPQQDESSPIFAELIGDYNETENA